jgi:hypothetical protein
MNFKDQILRKLRLQGQKSNFTRLLNIDKQFFIFYYLFIYFGLCYFNLVFNYNKEVIFFKIAKTFLDLCVC